MSSNYFLSSFFSLFYNVDTFLRLCVLQLLATADVVGTCSAVATAVGGWADDGGIVALRGVGEEHAIEFRQGERANDVAIGGG